MGGQAWRPGVQNSRTRENKEASCTWWFLIPQGGDIHNYESHGCSEDCCLGTCNLAGELDWKKRAMLVSLTLNKWPQASMSPWSCLLITLIISKYILSPDLQDYSILSSLSWKPQHLLFPSPASYFTEKKKEETIKRHHPPSCDLCASQYCKGQC